MDADKFDLVQHQLQQLDQRMAALSVTMTTVARMEERLVTVFKQIEKHADDNNKLAARLAEIEMTTARRGVILTAFDKSFWLLGGAAIASAAKRLWEGG